jgi:hypothetical protein
MKTNSRILFVTLAFVVLLLAALASPPLTRPKARAQRIQCVNTLAAPFPQKDLVITNLGVTNGLEAWSWSQ